MKLIVVSISSYCFEIAVYKEPFLETDVHGFMRQITLTHYLLLQKTKGPLLLLFTKNGRSQSIFKQLNIQPAHILKLFKYLSQTLIYCGNFTLNTIHLYRGNHVEENWLLRLEPSCLYATERDQNLSHKCIELRLIMITVILKVRLQSRRSFM